MLYIVALPFLFSRRDLIHHRLPYLSHYLSHIIYIRIYISPSFFLPSFRSLSYTLLIFILFYSFYRPYTFLRFLSFSFSFFLLLQILINLRIYLNQIIFCCWFRFRTVTYQNNEKKKNQINKWYRRIKKKEKRWINKKIKNIFFIVMNAFIRKSRGRI